MKSIGRQICLLAGAAALLAGPARAQQEVALDYGDALRQMSARSGAVQGAELDVQAKQLQAGALRRIDGPDLRLNGFAGRVSTSISVDTTRLAQSLDPILQPVAGLFPPLPAVALPELPDSLQARRVFNLRSLGLGSVWPVYTGGRLEALKELAAARAGEAGAALRTAREEAAEQLAQRYFGVQLARHAARVRAAAVSVALEHQDMARKLERTGLIARVDRLKAEVAADRAAREAAKAASDLEIAELALRRMLGEGRPVRPVTPLFVHAHAVAPLAVFVDAALAANPAWQQIDSKRAQAAANLKLQGRAFSPTVVGVANYNLNRGGNARADWLVGVALSVPLVDRIDRAKLASAARLEQQRVEAAAEQAGRDIPTLAESQWRAMEDARQRYLALGSALELGRETLRLAQVGFRQGQSTTADVEDASLSLASTTIERTQAAYDYVLALARLLGTTGAADQLATHARSAPYLIDPDKE